MPDPAPPASPKVNAVQRGFERGLWLTRLLALIAVAASIVMAVGAFLMATIDVFYLVQGFGAYADISLPLAEHNAVRAKLVAYIVKALDGYLIATLLLVFAFGLYELFVRNMTDAERSPVAPRLLRFESIDDLKDRVFKLVLLLLIVQFFDETLDLVFHSPLELLMLGGGIFLVGAAFFVSNLSLGRGH
ncbi:MAG: YqhA family protein [Dehalococcoidia bacterium]